MRALTGTWALVRLLLRRDRIRVPAWIAGITALIVLSTTAVDDQYPTQRDLEARADLVSGNPAMIAITGPGHGLDEPTLGRVLANDLGGLAMVVVALMSIFLVVRHTRAEEESGRAELVRSTAVGRHADTAASMIVVGAANLLVGGAAALSLILLDLPAAGSVAFGASLTAAGLAFASVAGVTAQVSEHARTATGLAGAALGIAYLLRAAGDIGNGVLSWLSPIGWSQAIRPFADERLWPLLISLAFAGGLVLVAVALTNRRDVGGGLVASRPGSPRASSVLAHPIGLALRLQRTAILGWSGGILIAGAVYGGVGREVEDLVAENPGLEDVLPQVEGGITDLFLAMVVSLLVVIATGFGIQSALRLRGEETERRAIPVLSTALSRPAWVGAHLAVAVGGSALVFAAGGLGLGGAFAIAAGEPSALPRLLGATLAYLPAGIVLVGLAVALFGLVPRLVSVPWFVLGGALLIGPFGDLLNVPGWVRDLSPFEHVGDVPAADPAFGALAILTALAAALATAGIAGFRRRDLD